VLALVLASQIATPAYGQRACPGGQAADLGFELRAEPADVAVGDTVDVEVRISAGADAHAAIPLFRLWGAEPTFAVEAQDSSYPALAYAHYRLRAVQPGDATLRVAVNFATTSDCGDARSLVFRSAHSPPMTIHVDDVANDEPGT